MRRDIEINAEGLTLRGWSYVPHGAKKMKYFLAALLLVSSLALSATVQARTNESGVRPQADRIYGSEVAAPPWSAACMTDHGPSNATSPCGSMVAAARDTRMRSIDRLTCAHDADCAP
jgi:hypothetical protein